MWQDDNERRRSSCSTTSQESPHHTTVEIVQHHNHHTQHEVDTMRNLLIDFSSEMDITAELCSKDHKQYFQNTWVSFEDDQGSNESLKLPPINKPNLWDRSAMIMSS